MGKAPPTLDGLTTIFESLVGTLMALGGIVLFFMIVTSAFKYLTSGGDPKAAEGAKKTLTYAIGGLVLLAGSYLILQIIGKITGTGTTITDFKITR